MNQFSPKQIILHCGLHKTGSTYIQRNLQGNRKGLLELGVLYIGPTTLKNRLKELWRHIEFGHQQKPTPRTKEQTFKTFISLAEGYHENIDIIFISFESLFGTLSKGLLNESNRKTSKRERKSGLYRYAHRRIKRLINLLEKTLSTKNIKWTILFGTREKSAFIHSCHTQLVKEGNIMTETTCEQLAASGNFDFSDGEVLTERLKQLNLKRDVTIIPFNYEKLSNKYEPSEYLWNVIDLALPSVSADAKAAIEANADNLNINQKINPSLSDRGLEIADQARPIFDKREWKLFRKFLEKNFSKNY